MEDWFGLGLFVSQLNEKTAAERASEDLTLPAYLAGFEDSFYGDNLEFGKVASQAAGREIMNDFIGRMLLDK